MLASEQDGGPMLGRGFNLASDIVELVVLTTDESFLQTLRDAVGGARRLWHVASGDKVSDLLIAGEVGILVLDVPALHESPEIFVSQIKRQFPDLVIVVAGHRDAETALAGLISAGTIYRFIHKPMSPGRAKLFADAAVKKYEEQRRLGSQMTSAARDRPRGARWIFGAAAGLACVTVIVAWLFHHGSDQSGRKLTQAAQPAAESPVLARAATALAANRLTEPGGESALDLYLQALARNPVDTTARAGLAEVHERLLARAENALIEERLDEAAIAIQTARKSGVESARISFLTAQLAKARAQLKSAQNMARSRAEARQPDSEGHVDARPVDERAVQFANLATERILAGHLTAPERDNASFYALEALRVDPGSATAQDAQESVALALLGDARAAIDRRDFSHAANSLDAAKGLASAANVDNVQQLLIAARRQAESGARDQLLKSAEERLQQDRLIEPANDNARYYLMTLRGLDPADSRLAPAVADLGARLVAKARRALALNQIDAARSWLEEATAIEYSSADSLAVARELAETTARQNFLDNVVAANLLTLESSVNPTYPRQAQVSKTEGWVELEFTVADSGAVQDIAVRAASPRGVFDDAAISAVLQWRYKPVLRDGKAVAQRARIRIRFALGS